MDGYIRFLYGSDTTERVCDSSLVNKIGKMNRRFGGGRPPTGTPSIAWSTLVVVVSLLAGASVVHNIYKPDLTLPSVEEIKGETPTTKKD
uniref:Uncharacterized protein n=1 Tax=Kalanchoe fedtschenkoi TaxID=63787 RepID=A0A7N0V1P6_KALFE